MKILKLPVNFFSNYVLLYNKLFFFYKPYDRIRQISGKLGRVRVKGRRMIKRSFLIVVLAAISINSSALAKTVSVSELQDLPPANLTIADPGKTFNKNHWAYKTLENISKKYGLLVGQPSEKFDASKPLTRNEAAVLLVSLVGKIEQDKLQLSDIEKDRIEILKQELGDEIQALTGRVAAVETSVNNLQGSVSRLQEADSSNVKVGFGEKFKLTGSAQARFNGNIRRGADRTPPNFTIPLAELGFNGKIRPHLNLVANFQPGRYYDGATKTMMGDLFVSTDIVPHHTFYMGQARIPIGYEGTASSLITDAVVKSQIARNFSDKRDIGIKTAGNWKYLDYYVGAFNGTRYTSADNNSDMDIASWVNFKPLASHPEFGKFILGGGYTVGNGNWSYNNFGGYAEYNLKKYTAKFEYGRQNGYLAHGRDSQGFYVTNLYNLTPKVQLVTKIDRFDPNVDTSRNMITELTGGANYFMSNNNIKLQLNYVYVVNRSANNSQRIVAQTQYNF